LTGTVLAGCSEDDPLLPCAVACVLDASCQEIEAAYCNFNYNDFATCLDDCQSTLAPPVFHCQDGSRVPARWRCDGARDCPNGEDEQCPLGAFTCTDGLEIPLGWRCDGVADCTSEEDEIDCASVPFACGDGTMVQRSRVCDGTSDCPGGEDELDCTRLACP
jgi:hypothetical protein